MASGQYNPRGIGNEQAPNLASYLVSFVCTMVVVIWQSITLSLYTSSFPVSVITGAHGDLNNSCLNLYRVLNLAFFLSIFVSITDIAMLLLSAVGESEDVQAFLSSFFDYSATMARVFIVVMGTLTLFLYTTAEETSVCPDLYDCVWWCVFGIFFISFLVVVGLLSLMKAGIVKSANMHLGHRPDRCEERDSAVTFGDTDVWEHNVSIGSGAMGRSRSEWWDGTDDGARDDSDKNTDVSDKDTHNSCGSTTGPKADILRTPSFA